MGKLHVPQTSTELWPFIGRYFKKDPKYRPKYAYFLPQCAEHDELSNLS